MARSRSYSTGGVQSFMRLGSRKILYTALFSCKFFHRRREICRKPRHQVQAIYSAQKSISTVVNGSPFPTRKDRIGNGTEREISRMRAKLLPSSNRRSRKPKANGESGRNHLSKSLRQCFRANNRQANLWRNISTG